ncbi:hypothetical protein [Rubripirellula lacrimiformis]|uniref:hypothetical protein n=1 Tax=Rubripirellula lacrimiformis TaxID=1930273 RepID=UPI001C54F45A|nr:hypothetical protein [Rubripirellula lacrimiformis]
MKPTPRITLTSIAVRGPALAMILEEPPRFAVPVELAVEQAVAPVLVRAAERPGAGVDRSVFLTVPPLFLDGRGAADGLAAVARAAMEQVVAE